jgi:P pilus assembly chaperone PapD
VSGVRVPDPPPNTSPIARHVRSFLAAALFALLAGSVNAQGVRPNIPPDAAEGKITAAGASQIEIDGKPYRLAPGARILNQRNLTVTPNMVTPGSQARYTLDAGGQVRAVWLVDGVDRAGAAPVQRTPGTN